MKKIGTLIVLCSVFLSCQAQPDPIAFSKKALNDTFVNLEGESVSFQSVLDQYKGQTILIDVWASWCRDCIVGLPNLKALQEEYKDIVYLFLSMDKTQENWKNAIAKYEITGSHYFMSSGWKSDFSDFAGLDWVPRYMVVGADGDIKLYRAIKANDPKIKEQLK